MHCDEPRARGTRREIEASVFFFKERVGVGPGRRGRCTLRPFKPIVREKEINKDIKIMEEKLSHDLP